MHRFRHRRATAAWLALIAIVLGGGLVAAHSHDDGLPSGTLSAVALSGMHDRLDTAHVDSATSSEVELCPACAVGQRQGALDATRWTARSWVMATQGVRAADSPAISGSDAQPPSPRGPPTV